MKRSARPLLLAATFLLFGAVLNVAVAWGSLLVSDRIAANSLRSRVDIETRWPRPVPARWPEPGRAFRIDGLGCSQDSVLVVASGPPLHACSLDVGEAGWPWRALAWERWGEQVRRGEGATVSIHDGHPTTIWRLGVRGPVLNQVQDPRMLPIRPIWPGFTVNTLLYAAIAMGAFIGLCAGVRRVRSIRRGRRGLCRACGYSRAGLADDAVCPECGGMQR